LLINNKIKTKKDKTKIKVNYLAVSTRLLEGDA